MTELAAARVSPRRLCSRSDFHAVNAVGVEELRQGLLDWAPDRFSRLARCHVEANFECCPVHAYDLAPRHPRDFLNET
jgi:hypothetical protein